MTFRKPDLDDAFGQHFVSEIPDHNIPLNESKARNFLLSQNFPPGFATAFVKNAELVPIRFFICDDSGSMNENDGNKLITTKAGAIRSVQCSRWEELKESIAFHAELAHESNSLTEFRFLNGPPSIIVGDFERDPDGCGLRALRKVLDSGPSGGTPLCLHVREITKQIQIAAERLRAANQVACITICTDGMCSDGDLVQAMKPLERLPCWIVIKLCTDDDQIVQYWNGVDGQLELDMDVLDDYESEGKEVMGVNPWLVYGLQLHRLREWGFKLLKELDMMDERMLSPNQMLNVMCLLYDKKPSDFNSVQGDPLEFKRDLKRVMNTIPAAYNPLTKTVGSWVNYRQVKRSYNLPTSSKCSIM